MVFPEAFTTLSRLSFYSSQQQTTPTVTSTLASAHRRVAREMTNSSFSIADIDSKGAMMGDHLHVVTNRFPIEAGMGQSPFLNNLSALPYLVNLSLRQTKAYGERSEKWFPGLDYQGIVNQGNEDSSERMETGKEEYTMPHGQ